MKLRVSCSGFFLLCILCVHLPGVDGNSGLRGTNSITAQDRDLTQITTKDAQEEISTVQSSAVERQKVSQSGNFLQSLIIIKAWAISIFSISIALLLSASTFRMMRNVVTVLSWEGLSVLSMNREIAGNISNTSCVSSGSSLQSDSTLSSSDFGSSIRQILNDDSTTSTKNTTSSSDQQNQRQNERKKNQLENDSGDDLQGINTRGNKPKRFLSDADLSSRWLDRVKVENGVNGSGRNKAHDRRQKKKNNHLEHAVHRKGDRGKCENSQFDYKQENGGDWSQKSIESGSSRSSILEMRPQLHPRSLLEMP